MGEEDLGHTTTTDAALDPVATIDHRLVVISHGVGVFPGLR
jgi:hypothetical protein